MIIAGAGGAAHLPGMLAAVTPLPVIGVPVPLRHLDGLDSLLSIVQMPSGVPVATVAIGGARNAGLLAVRILAATDPSLQQAMVDFQERLADSARAKGETCGADRRAAGLLTAWAPVRDDAAAGHRSVSICAYGQPPARYRVFWWTPIPRRKDPSMNRGRSTAPHRDSRRHRVRARHGGRAGVRAAGHSRTGTAAAARPVTLRAAPPTR